MLPCTYTHSLSAIENPTRRVAWFAYHHHLIEYLTAGVKGGRKIQCLEESSRIEGKFEICHLTLMFPRSMINVHLPFYISEKNLNYFSHHENLKIRERKRLRSHTTYSSSFSVASSQPFQAVARNKFYVSCSDV